MSDPSGIDDQALVDLLSEFRVENFTGEVFRTTGANPDPLAVSFNGGRWPPRARNGFEVPILIPVLNGRGIGGGCLDLSMLIPPPLSKPLKVSRLRVSASSTIRLVRSNLEALGVDMARHGTRDHARTQVIGAAMAFLGIDGPVAPSARWRCDNLMIFSSNHVDGGTLDFIDDELVEWGTWARQHGFLSA